jgi:hypothetical protein
MGPIRVYKRTRPADAPKPLLDPEKRHADEVAAHVAEKQHAADQQHAGEPVAALPESKVTKPE